MCQLIVDEKFIQDGWGCCHCPDNAPGMKTFNGLHRGECKCCGTPHCALGTAETDILEAQAEVNAVDSSVIEAREVLAEKSDDAWQQYTHFLCTGQDEWSFHERCICDRCFSLRPPLPPCVKCGKPAEDHGFEPGVCGVIDYQEAK